jgi:two-component system invasion response regulator UvrY
MNIVLIDDHFVSRMGIRHLIKENFKNVNFLETKHDVKLPEKISAQPIDLIMVGITTDDQVNLRTWEQISSLDLETPIVIYCSHIKYYQLVKFLTDGAMGILFKNQEPEEFVRCVKEVLMGRRYICHEALVMIADQVIGGKDKFKETLTPKELLIANQLKNGQGTSAIAKTLNLALSAVSISKAKIFKKLGVKNILELREIMNSGIMSS